MAELLIEQKKYSEAKTEIAKIIDVRKENNWRIPNAVAEWTEQPWYKSTQVKKDNSPFYRQYLKVAEELLYQDIPEETVAVEFVNSNKNILNFVKDEMKHGFFNFSSLIENPMIGDILKVRFDGDGHEGYFKVLTAKKMDGNYQCAAMKNFQGTIHIKGPVHFGFVENVFVEPKLILQKNIVQDQHIQGKAILSFNKKKNEWGWKAIQID